MKIGFSDDPIDRLRKFLTVLYDCRILFLVYTIKRSEDLVHEILKDFCVNNRQEAGRENFNVPLRTAISACLAAVDISIAQRYDSNPFA